MLRSKAVVYIGFVAGSMQTMDSFQRSCIYIDCEDLFFVTSQHLGQMLGGSMILRGRSCTMVISQYPSLIYECLYDGNHTSLNLSLLTKKLEVDNTARQYLKRQFKSVLFYLQFKITINLIAFQEEFVIFSPMGCMDVVHVFCQGVRGFH